MVDRNQIDEDKKRRIANLDEDIIQKEKELIRMNAEAREAEAKHEKYAKRETSVHEESVKDSKSML